MVTGENTETHAFSWHQEYNSRPSLSIFKKNNGHNVFSTGAMPMAVDAKAVGRRLTEEREIRSLSLSAVAEKAGIAKSYLLKLERGEVHNPGLATLGAVAKALDITLAQLFAPAPGRVASKTVKAGDEGNLELLKAKMPASLRSFLQKLESSGETVPADVVRSLAVIQFRGQRPQREEDWEFIYQAVKRSVRRG